MTMALSRRGFLTAIPAVVAPAVTVPAALMMTTETTAAPAGSAAIGEVHVPQWWYSPSTFEPEWWTRCFPSKEAATAFAQTKGGGSIALCLQQDYLLRPRADWLLEHLFDVNEERVGEDDEDLFCVKPEQEKDLEDMIEATMWAWARKHGLRTTARMFAEVSDEEGFPYPKDHEEDPV